MSSYGRILTTDLRAMPTGTIVEIGSGSRYRKIISGNLEKWRSLSTGTTASSGMLSLNNLRVVSELELLAETANNESR